MTSSSVAAGCCSAQDGSRRASTCRGRRVQPVAFATCGRGPPCGQGTVEVGGRTRQRPTRPAPPAPSTRRGVTPGGISRRSACACDAAEAAGTRIDPPMSEPNSSGVIPAARAAALPPDSRPACARSRVAGAAVDRVVALEVGGTAALVLPRMMARRSGAARPPVLRRPSRRRPLPRWGRPATSWILDGHRQAQGLTRARLARRRRPWPRPGAVKIAHHHSVDGPVAGFDTGDGRVSRSARFTGAQPAAPAWRSGPAGRRRQGLRTGGSLDPGSAFRPSGAASRSVAAVRLGGSTDQIFSML